MSKPLTYAAITLAVALPFAAQAKTAKPASDPAAPASSSAPSTSGGTSSSATTTPSTATPATPPTAATPPAAATAPSANAAAGAGTDASTTAPAFAVGTPVKDNTGAVIGSISELKPGATGAQTATIKMGSDQFAVVTSGLALQDGSAVINMTQAELQAKLHPAAAPK